MTSPNKTVSFTTSCCNTDSCMPPAPIFPENEMIDNHSSMKPNLCPTCLATDTNLCVEKYAMPCKENYTQCARFSQTVGNVSTIIQGCATEIFCQNSKLLRFIEGTVTCTTATTNSTLPAHYFLYCSGNTVVNSQTVYSKPGGKLCSQYEDACVSESSWIKNDNEETIETVLRCGRSSECSRYGVISNPNKRIHFNTSCCYSDKCIVVTPTYNGYRHGHQVRPQLCQHLYAEMGRTLRMVWA
ncbi:uncharacterized protein LOC134576773 [Pelobates fuscus]|uniref:uncharacterized protein LOC134576773 n=1 Tax=Pelobates fuscus TaxID=191477 RepID=UPI002FE47739